MNKAMNERFIKKFDLITKKNKELDEIEDELNELNDELVQIFTDIFRNDGVLEGSWTVSLDTISIVFHPNKLKHKKLLDKYRKYINTNSYIKKINFWTSTGDPVDISLLENYQMKLCMLNLDPENVQKFLVDYKISIKEFKPIRFGIDMAKISKIQDKLLAVVGK